jgi:hypothetical protein
MELSPEHTVVGVARQEFGSFVRGKFQIVPHSDQSEFVTLSRGTRKVSTLRKQQAKYKAEN